MIECLQFEPTIQKAVWQSCYTAGEISQMAMGFAMAVFLIIMAVWLFGGGLKYTHTTKEVKKAGRPKKD
jgi:hypothetical protein